MDLMAAIGLLSSIVTLEEAGRSWVLIVKDKLKRKEIDINNWDSDDPLVQACLDRFKTDMGDKYKNHIFSEEEIQEIIRGFFEQNRELRIGNEEKKQMTQIIEDILYAYNEYTKSLMSSGERTLHNTLSSDFSKIMDKLDTYVVEIYGEGQLRNHIQEQIENMGLENRIFLKGHSDNVFNEIEDAKLFVMSSDYEGMPNALMEAMAMGLPCIATDCPIGGSREIIRDGENGILVPVNDSDYLANEILKVLGDNDLQCRLSLEASKIRNTLDISVIAKKWEELL